MNKIICKRMILFLVTLVMLVSVSFTEAQQAIFLVRHAEQSAETDDPELTEAGKKRAQALASVLKDAGINVIYTTERRRAIQTAEPAEKLLNIVSQRLALRDLDGLVARLRNQHTNDRILVVSHHLALPRLLKALGHPAEVAIALHETIICSCSFRKVKAAQWYCACAIRPRAEKTHELIVSNRKPITGLAAK